MNSKAVSFMDPEVQKCPFPAYNAVRELGPVYVDPATGWFVVTDYDLVRQLTADTTNLSNFTGALFCKRNSDIQDQIDKIYTEEGFLPTPALVVMDPPDHSFHRSFVDKSFTPARVKAMEEYLDGVTDELIDSFIGRGEVDFKEELAVKLPLYVIADQLGMPRSDVEQLNVWSQAVVENLDQSNTPERQIELARSICGLHRYAAAMVEEYRKKPRECLLSDFANVVVDGRQLSMREIAVMVEQVLAGGNDSSANGMANGMLRLVQQPGLQEQLRARPDLIPNFIEEVLRLDAPVQGLFREPKKDMEIGGVAIPAGSVVVLKWGAANRDPKQFPVPDALDINRPNSRRHMTFGFGPHNCVGNLLARGEMRVVFSKMLARMKNVRLAEGRPPPEREPHFFAYGFRHLYIAFDRM